MIRRLAAEGWELWLGGVALLCAVLVLASCTTDRGAEPVRFVGSDACQGCHPEEFATWKDNYHAKMVRAAHDGLLKEAREYWAVDPHGNPGPRRANATGAHMSIDDVVFVVGSKWKQRYLVRNAMTGKHQFLDKQWNAYTQVWEPFGETREWETQCSTCHTAGFRAAAFERSGHGDDGSAGQRKPAAHDPGCETCHGPGSSHVTTRSKSDIYNPKNASHEDAERVCAHCHDRPKDHPPMPGHPGSSAKLGPAAGPA